MQGSSSYKPEMNGASEMLSRAVVIDSQHLEMSTSRVSLQSLMPGLHGIQAAWLAASRFVAFQPQSSNGPPRRTACTMLISSP